jgi:hypothetical protein
MDKIDIDRKIAERADEFAEREYECGAEERAHLSKGYYLALLIKYRLYESLAFFSNR